jgi:hypothetical protein
MFQDQLLVALWPTDMLQLMLPWCVFVVVFQDELTRNRCRSNSIMVWQRGVDTGVHMSLHCWYRELASRAPSQHPQLYQEAAWLFVCLCLKHTQPACGVPLNLIVSLHNVVC